MIATSKATPFAAETESRLQDFTELAATAIANAEVARLADEQAALRRVATLVAEGAAHGTVFDAVTAEVSGVLEASGHGLMGIADRVDALGGRLTIQSAAGDGTALVARLPLCRGVRG
jgi:hypothetical protein